MTWVLAALKAAAAFFGFGEKVTAEVHDANQRVAGADHVTAQSNAAKAKVNSDVAQAIVDTNDDAAAALLHDGRA